jgi:hypothetical protein
MHSTDAVFRIVRTLTGAGVAQDLDIDHQLSYYTSITSRMENSAATEIRRVSRAFTLRVLVRTFAIASRLLCQTRSFVTMPSKDEATGPFSSFFNPFELC